MRLETKEDYQEFVKTEAFMNFVKKECPVIADQIDKILFLGFLPVEKWCEFEIWMRDRTFARAYFTYGDLDTVNESMEA